MGSEASRHAWGFWGRWLIATALGWVAGILAAIILSDVVVNLVYPKETNLIVGLCMGALMGLFQTRAVRRWLSLSRWWVWGAILIVAPPFIAVVFLRELTSVTDGSTRLLVAAVAVVCGLAGAWVQERALRPHTTRSRWWVPAIAVSWALTLATGQVGFMLGGVVLGAVSGVLLLWVLNSPPSAQTA